MVWRRAGQLKTSALSLSNAPIPSSTRSKVTAFPAPIAAPIFLDRDPGPFQDVLESLRYGDAQGTAGLGLGQMLPGQLCDPGTPPHTWTQPGAATAQSLPCRGDA